MSYAKTMSSRLLLFCQAVFLLTGIFLTVGQDQVNMQNGDPLCRPGSQRDS